MGLSGSAPCPFVMRFLSFRDTDIGSCPIHLSRCMNSLYSPICVREPEMKLYSPICIPKTLRHSGNQITSCQYQRLNYKTCVLCLLVRECLRRHHRDIKNEIVWTLIEGKVLDTLQSRCRTHIQVQHHPRLYSFQQNLASTL